MQDALSRFTREVFQESAASLEALWKNAPEAEDEWEETKKQAQLDIESFLKDGGFFSEKKDLTELEKEARILMKRAKKLLLGAVGTKREELKETINELKEALEKNDGDILSSAIDEITDLLIDMEE